MATEVTRSLSEIDSKIKQLDSSIKACSAATRSLNKSLKLDPSSADLIASKTANLKKQMELAVQKLDLLKQKQKEIKAQVDAGSVPVEEYNKLSIKVAQAAAEVKGLSIEVKNANNARLNNLQNSLSGVSRVCTVILGSLATMALAFAQTGDAISDASHKFNISAEIFQKNANIFDKVTGNSNGYTSALTSATTLLGQVEKGSSKAQTNLALLNLTLDDMKGLSAPEALDLIISRLQTLEDVDERASIATALLGTSGAEVAMVANTSAEEIANLTAALEKAGIISQEDADKAGDLNDKLGYLKSEFKAVATELLIALIPAIEALMGIISAVAPLISGLAKFFTALGRPMQFVLITVITLVAVLPKLIAIVKTVNTVMTLLGSNPIGAKILLICTAVALLIMLLVELAKWLSGIFGKKYSVELDTSAADSVLDGTAQEQLAVETKGDTYITYNDNTTQTNTFESRDDVEDIIEALYNKKIQVGGAR